MNLVTVMTQLATQLDTIAGLRVFGYPPDSVSPPAAIVDLPDEIVYDETYGRGMDRITLPVVLVVGRVSDRTSSAAIAAYAAGSGSIKTVLEAGTYTAMDTVRVARGEFDVVRIAGTDYWQAKFDVDIVGEGA